jgi:hypothetical protein
MMSSYCDGSGNLKAKHGTTTTLPDWRQLERTIAEMMSVTTPEDKGVFDVIVPSPDDANVVFGLSVKSKELKRSVLNGDEGGRGYMELCNSPAKLWKGLEAIGIKPQDFRDKKYAQKIGDNIINTVVGWHNETASLLKAKGQSLDLKRSVYLTVSYSKHSKTLPRLYQIHSFDLDLATNLTWSYRTKNSIKAEDPAHPGKVLFDWFPFSGGQVKYYPRMSTSRFHTEAFTLLEPEFVPLSKKVHMLWPSEWIAAGGLPAYSREDVLDLMRRCAQLATAESDRQIICNAVQALNAE